MKDHPLLTKTALAIFAILILASLAIWRNIDGALLGSAIAIIAGLGGYAVGQVTKPK